MKEASPLWLIVSYQYVDWTIGFWSLRLEEPRGICCESATLPAKVIEGKIASRARNFILENFGRTNESKFESRRVTSVLFGGESAKGPSLESTRYQRLLYYDPYRKNKMYEELAMRKFFCYAADRDPSSLDLLLFLP